MARYRRRFLEGSGRVYAAGNLPHLLVSSDRGVALTARRTGAV
jgi:hypothetical protein